MKEVGSKHQIYSSIRAQKKRETEKNCKIDNEMNSSTFFLNFQDTIKRLCNPNNKQN